MSLHRVQSLLVFLVFLSFTFAASIPQVDYDVIVVGGGPSGLSALSGLGRMRRKAIMFDSTDYRNGLTRHVHDVIGSDGVSPSAFRAKARSQISRYETVQMKNATITSIEKIENEGKYASYFVATDAEGEQYTARKIVLGTGLKDVLPNTPGLAEAWSRGIYWCPWCDGFEHRDQPIGVLGSLSDVLSNVLELHTLNKDIMALVNGTFTPKEESISSERSSTWAKQLEAYNVPIDNRTIASIERLQDGSDAGVPEEWLEFDKFRVHFTEGASVNRSAFITNFPTAQRSTLPSEMGVNIDKNNKMQTALRGMRTNIDGVFGVGDANNDSSTNVPHAMWSGKRAAVSIHVEIERENSLDLVTRWNSDEHLEEEALKLIGRDLEELWVKS